MTARRESDICFLLFLVAALAGLAQLTSPIPFGEGFEMVAVAKSLVSQGAFADPFAVARTGVTAVEPPGYPLFLAAVMATLRNQFLVLLALFVGNVAANAAIAALLPRVSAIFYGSPVPGIVASLFWIAVARVMPSWDVSYTTAGLLLLCLYSHRALAERQEHRAGTAVAIGGLAGLLLSLNPASLLVFLPWFAWLALRGTGLWIMRARFWATLGLTLSLLPTAWMLRNQRAFGSFVLRTNLGMTLYASNNECASPSLLESEQRGCYQSHHPNVSRDEAALLVHLGEVAYDRKRVADTVDWLAHNPGAFAKLTMTRCWQFWFPSTEENGWTAVVIWLGTALSLPGLSWMIRRRGAAGWYMALVLALYPGMYYIVVTDVRYRYPVLWLTFLLAGYFVWLLARLPGWTAWSRAQFGSVSDARR